jgi:methionine synthase II (cobalamin-independent)
MIGRSLSLLMDMPVEIVPSGWRISDHRSSDGRRARDLLSRDVDALEEIGSEHVGPLKLQVAGPWTLAAALELHSGHSVLIDSGARRDLLQSLSAGIAAHVADVQRRLPQAQVILQLDEPGLPAVLQGRVPTPSGYGSVSAVDGAVAQQWLSELLEATGAAATVIHCCAPHVPLALLGGTGADALSIDARLLAVKDYDAIGELVEDGVSLWLGVLDARDSEAPSLDPAVDAIAELWSRLGFDPALLAAGVVPTTSCGLAGASPQFARQALAIVARVGEAILDPERAEHLNPEERRERAAQARE